MDFNDLFLTNLKTTHFLHYVYPFIIQVYYCDFQWNHYLLRNKTNNNNKLKTKIFKNWNIKTIWILYMQTKQ